MILTYKIKTATEDVILTHLKECNYDFIPPLSDRVDLQEYSKKIFERSVTFEAWEKQILVGLISGYFNNTIKKIGYITNVSLMKKYMGLGIATKLLSMCINYTMQNNYKIIHLEVSKNNNRAIHLYEKFGFRIIKNYEDNIIMNLEIKSCENIIKPNDELKV